VVLLLFQPGMLRSTTYLQQSLVPVYENPYGWRFLHTGMLYYDVSLARSASSLGEQSGSRICPVAVASTLLGRINPLC